MATTQYDWEIDGVSLSTFAWNVRTLSGRMVTSRLRGDNDTRAYRHGATWNPKYAEPKVVSLAMWLRGWGTEEGDKPADQGAKFWENWNAFTSLISNGRRLHTLTKRWPDTDGSPLSADAQVEFPNGIDLDMQMNGLGVYTLDCLLPDPYFYGAEETLTVAAGASLLYTPKGNAQGTGYGQNIEFTGQLSNPTLYFGPTDNDPWLKVSLDINVADHVDVNVRDFLATRDSDAANVTGSLRRSGMHGLSHVGFSIPDDEVLRLVTDAGAGSATITYRPAWE